MVKGARQLERRLVHKVPKLIRKRSQKAMEKGADEIVALMKSLVAKDSGDLANAIGWTWGKVPKGALIFGTIPEPVTGNSSITFYAGNKKAFYARFVEFGVNPHTNKGKFEGTQHPGTAPQPFFFVAFRRLRKKVKSRITREINKAIKESNK